MDSQIFSKVYAAYEKASYWVSFSLLPLVTHFSIKEWVLMCNCITFTLASLCGVTVFTLIIRVFFRPAQVAINTNELVLSMVGSLFVGTVFALWKLTSLDGKILWQMQERSTKFSTGDEHGCPTIIALSLASLSLHLSLIWETSTVFFVCGFGIACAIVGYIVGVSQNSWWWSLAGGLTMLIVDLRYSLALHELSLRELVSRLSSLPEVISYHFSTRFAPVPWWLYLGITCIGWVIGHWSSRGKLLRGLFVRTPILESDTKGKLPGFAVLLLVIVTVVASCFISVLGEGLGQATISQPTATPIPGWKKFEGGGAELWLPASYEGGDISEDLDVLVERLRALGPDFEQMAQMIEQNPSAFVILAFDSEVGDSGVLTNVSVAIEGVLSVVTLDSYLDAVIKQLPSQYRVVERVIVSLDHYQAGRIALEFTVMGVRGKQVTYVIKSGNTVWAVIYGTGADEFDQRLPTFERSIRTFAIQP